MNSKTLEEGDSINGVLFVCQYMRICAMRKHDTCSCKGRDAGQVVDDDASSSIVDIFPKKD